MERTMPSRESMRVPSRSRKMLEITFRLAAYLLLAEASRHSCATLLRRPIRSRVRSNHIAGERFHELRLRLVLDHLPVSHDDLPNGPFCDPAQAPRSFRMIPQQQQASCTAGTKAIGNPCQSPRDAIEAASKTRHVEGKIGENQSSRGMVEEHHLGDATYRTEHGEIKLTGPTLRWARAELLCGWEVRHALEEARGHEKAGGWIVDHELRGVDVMKRVRRNYLPDDTDGIDRGGGTRLDQRRR